MGSSATGPSQTGEGGTADGGKSRLGTSVYSIVAVPSPAPQRRVFRPARRVSWGTRLFAFLVLMLAIGTAGAFFVVLLPQRVAALAQLEGNELSIAQKGAADVSTSVTGLWNDLAAKGSMSLSPDQLVQDLALSRRTETSADTTLGHVQAGETYLAQIDGIPFQLHTPAIVATDRPVILHLEKTLGAAIKLAHGATLQLTIAQHLSQDAATLNGSLAASLNSRDWSAAARTAATLVTDVKTQEDAAADPETLLDPLWSKWMDAMIAYANTAQQYSLASGGGQTQTAQQLNRALAAAHDQIGAALAAAQNNAAVWQAKTVQPLIETTTKELAAGS